VPPPIADPDALATPAGAMNPAGDAGPEPAPGAPPQAAQPGADTQLTPGVTGDNVPGSGTASTLPPRPTRPPLTGDPAKDIQASLAYERALDDWHGQALGQATSQQNQIAATAAQKDLALAKEEQAKREAMRQQQEQERAARQASIDDAVKERMAAQGNIENGTWRGDQSTGSKIWSVIAMATSAIGQGLSAAGGHPAENMAMKVIDERTSREYQIAKDRLSNANESVLQARYGYKDTIDNQRAALNDLDADFAAKHRLIAEEAAAQMKAKGVSPEMIANSELVNGNLQKASQYEDQIHVREIEAARKNELADSTIALNKERADAQAALARYRDRRNDKAAHAGAGGGGSKAVDAMVAAAEAGKSVGEVTQAGVHAGMSSKAASAQAKAYVDDYEKRKGIGGKGGKGPGGVDATKIVRDVDGTPLGIAPSGKGGAAALQSDLRTNMTALKQLRELRHDPGFLSGGPKFHDAVLALAATTTAGKTDTTTAHEKGSITNLIGMPDPKAIDRKIDQLQERVNGIHQQLAPLPEGYSEAGRGGNAQPKIDKAMIDKAKAAFDDPGAPAEAKRAAAKVLSAAGVI
jgi:hypothetical protein